MIPALFDNYSLDLAKTSTMSNEEQRVTLSPVDHLLPCVYTAAIYYMPLKPGVSPSEVFSYLQEGLHHTLLQVPWLNGKIHRQSRDAPDWRPGQLEIRYTPHKKDDPRPHQIRYNELKTSTSYTELKDNAFPLDVFADKDLLWVETMREDYVEQGIEVFAAQANFIPGACILVGGMHHSIADATGQVILMKLWADHCRGLNGQDVGPAGDMRVLLQEDSWDRSLLDKVFEKESTKRSAADMSPATWEMVGLDPPRTNNNASTPARTPIKQKAMKSRVFYMSPVEFKELRDECMKELGTADISGNDVLTALIWRSIVRARVAAAAKHEAALDAGTIVDIQVAVDGRPDFSRHMAVPQTYLGNLCFCHNPTLSVQDLIGPEASIGSVAQLIYNCARALDQQAMLDGYQILRETKDYGKVRPIPVAHYEGTYLFSSLLMIPDEMCLGDRFFKNDGFPDALRPMMGNHGVVGVPIVWVLPRTKAKGVEFVINMVEEELEYFAEDEELERYASLLA